MRRRDLILGATAQAALTGCSREREPRVGSRPLVIAHRGASGVRPEHTMDAYRVAVADGADYIEPDLVMTRDGVLVCRHENEISGTTDVAQRAEFAARRREQSVDGVSASGWWVEDFTLAELKTLRCRERLPDLRPANTAYDGREAIPTFAEVLALAREARVGVYPELKHPSFLRDAGLDPLSAFLAAVREAGGQSVADTLFVQCFEAWPLMQLAQMSSIRWMCVRLIGPGAAPDDAALAEIAGYARGIGVEKSLIVPRDAEGGSMPATDLVARAHAANLLVHAWTFRAENAYLPRELQRGRRPSDHGNLDAELKAFYAAGVDGVFSDFPGIAVAARG